MVSMAVLVVIVTIMVSATDQASQLARRTSGKIEQFEQARNGFERMTRRLGDATLNTYWDYFDKNGVPRNASNFTTFVPVNYGRQSELRFRSGRMSNLMANAPGVSHIPAYRPTHGVFFQAPVGQVDNNSSAGYTTPETDNEALTESLNTWGFFLELADDKDFVPDFLAGTIKPRIRSRLMELRQSTESLNVYKEIANNLAASNGTYAPITAPDNSASALKWFTDPITATPNRPVRVLAENIVALIVLPRLSQEDEAARLRSNPKSTPSDLCPFYEYDSTATNPNDPQINTKHQLPPVVQTIMVAIDEVTAARLATDPATASKKILA